MILLYDAWKHRATSENEAKKILYCKIHIGQNIPPLTKMTRHYSSANSFFGCYSRLIRRPSASFSAIFSEFLCLWWKCKWLMQGVKTSMGHWIYILHMRNEVIISQAQIFSVRKWRKKLYGPILCILCILTKIRIQLILGCFVLFYFAFAK